MINLRRRLAPGSKPCEDCIVDDAGALCTMNCSSAEIDTRRRLGITRADILAALASVVIQHPDLSEAVAAHPDGLNGLYADAVMRVLEGRK